MRMCIDYRLLNKKTIKNCYQIPRLDELIDEPNGSKYLSKIDLRSRYHQIQMKKGDIHKSKFCYHFGHLQFMVMPFGFTNTLGTF